MLIRKLTPYWAASWLWGDRRRWGLRVNPQDPCWTTWQETYLDFYQANQRRGIGSAVNEAGYRVMSRIDLEGKVVLEIGPGDIRHAAYWKGTPAEYHLADIQAGMLEKAIQRLDQEKVPTRPLLLRPGEPLPLPDSSVDAVVSFYSLEHIYPLAPYLQEITRVLKPSGALVGAVPAEGGVAWGAGRFLTSRRWLKRHTTIDPDKIICWEHPNFGDEILDELSRHFNSVRVEYWPFPWLRQLDFNLVIRFVCQHPTK